MAEGRYRLSEGCPHTKDELRNDLRDGRHTTEDVRLENGTTNIDSLDAMEYSFEAYMEEMLALDGRG